MKEDKKHNVPDAEDLVTIPRKEYEALKAKEEECSANYDKFVRSQADFDNARKRIEKEKADFVKYANESFVIDLLPIIDSLEMAEKHIKEAKDFNAVRQGVDMIHSQIQLFLKDIGVEKIKTAGGKFDPHFHEAMETIEDDGKEEGLIAGELKPGYLFNGKLLRPACVRIVKNTGLTNSA